MPSGRHSRLIRCLRMKTLVPLPVGDYLSRTTDPDCEYVDGHLVERNVGELATVMHRAAPVPSFYTGRRVSGLECRSGFKFVLIVFACLML